MYVYICISNIKHQKTLKTVFTCTRNANSLNILLWMAIAIPDSVSVSVLYMTLNVFVRDETDTVARSQQMIGFVTATAWMLVTTTINIIIFIGPSYDARNRL